MSEKEETIIKTLRNQILIIAITTCLGGLGMNFLFMFTINDTINRIQSTQDKQGEKIETLTQKYYELNKAP